MWQKMMGFSRTKLVTFAALLLLIALAAFTGSAVTTHADWNDYKLDTIEFYESGPETVPIDSRVYASRFNQDTVRYVNTEITLKNSAYGSRDFEMAYQVQYVNPDGSIRGTISKTIRIPRSYSHPSFSEGWGADNPGTWSAGIYTVKIYLDGRYAGSNTFEIYKSSYQLDTVKFFEAGAQLPAREYWRYATSFPKNYSRFIYTEITFTNPNYNVRNNEALIVFAYYRPDGALLQEVRSNFMIRKDWDAAYFSNGIGADSAGSVWQYGTYTVKIYMDGQYVGSGTFYMN